MMNIQQAKLDSYKNKRGYPVWLNNEYPTSQIGYKNKLEYYPLHP
jgi:hypothetical protein